jgi:hypothetical protein
MLSHLIDYATYQALGCNLPVLVPHGHQLAVIVEIEKFLGGVACRQFRLLSARSRLYAALINARCVKACGKLPSASPCEPVCSANSPR